MGIHNKTSTLRRAGSKRVTRFLVSLQAEGDFSNNWVSVRFLSITLCDIFGDNTTDREWAPYIRVCACSTAARRVVGPKRHQVAYRLFLAPEEMG
jgi:hypothetical protein